jgi:ERCC4-type nuclease
MPANGDTIKVVADDRERHSEVIPFLKAMTFVNLDVRRLSVGDYRVDNQLIFERKTLPDFSRSIADGRLFRQMKRLVNGDAKGVLILEGSGRDLPEVTVRREALQGALIFVSLTLGIPVLRAMNADETARLMCYAARQCRAAFKPAPSRRLPGPTNRRRCQLHVLQGLPGIGPEKAALLLEAFGSVESVLAADGDLLQTIPGIGAKSAEKIRWVVSDSQLPYGLQIDWPI